jgi:hypothetical protein
MVCSYCCVTFEPDADVAAVGSGGVMHAACLNKMFMDRTSTGLGDAADMLEAMGRIELASKARALMVELLVTTRPSGRVAS